MAGPAKGFGLNGRAMYANVAQPMFVFCNFVVDSANGNGFGVRSVKSNGYVNAVAMRSGASSPAGSPNLGTARDFAVLGASAISNTGSSVLSGQMGIFPGTAITGFPPGTVSGAVHATDVAASQAQSAALAAYTAMQAQSASVIATALDAQTLVPGVYRAASGTFSLAASAGGTLTLNGRGVYIFQTATTLVTGAGGTPVIALTNGARAQDVYFVVGSSATINSGNSGVFNGNIIAQASITDTLGGTVNGSLIALTGAVTLSAATTINSQPLAPAGFCHVRFSNNFHGYLGGFSGFVSPVGGSPVSITAAGAHLVVGQAYIIASVGTSTAADWAVAGLHPGLVPAVGQSFIAKATGAGVGSGAVMVPSVSGITSVEVIGDPNTMVSSQNLFQNGGAVVNLQFLSNGLPAAPVDGSVVGMCFIFDGSSVSIDGL